MRTDKIVPLPPRGEPPASRTPPRAQLFPDDESLLPEGSVVDGRYASHDVVDGADYVVIGTGAAGATAAVTLASAGYSVILVEEGEWVRTKEFTADVDPAMKRMYRDLAAQITVGPATYAVFQGRCVGGSTTINSAIALRAPDQVIERWGTAFGLGREVTPAILAPHFDALEKSLNVVAVAERVAGNHNTLFDKAAKQLGIQAQPIRRYDGGCLGSASCITGCPNGKKLGMNITYVPQTLKHGARLYTSFKALRLQTRWGRATGVEAQAPTGAMAVFQASRGVVVAASVVQTPGILKRSGVKLHALGRHFQAQPGTSFVARFDKTVAMDFGATQGFNSTHFVESDRFKIESLSLPPELLTLNLPGIGPSLTSKLHDYKHLLNWAMVLRAETEGRVVSMFGKDLVMFAPTQSDLGRVRSGLKKLAELMFAAGAKEVWPNIRGMGALKGPDDLRMFDSAPLNPSYYSLMLSHLFGTARMGPDARDAVVGTDFQVHGLRGAYVVDASVFPTNLGVNPQHSIMAMARLGATRIIERPLPKI
ncbi:MAG: GMC family oxidoreductase [Myxococcaceae bacterium]|nr:GMC family oxidoreductase [Myxococcaceae bacterium]